MKEEQQPTILIAASGTGGHLFPALAVAEELADYHIQWLGVPNRLETQLVPECYPLTAINIEGMKKRLAWGTLGVLLRLPPAIAKVVSLINQYNIQAVFTTGGYIAAPAIIAARLRGIPVIIHDSNAIPGKVTRWLARWCHTVALGFHTAERFFPPQKSIWVSTPVRKAFHSSQSLALPIAEDVPLIVVVGGSQGAVAVNQLVRESAQDWLDAGAAVVHLTGERDRAVDSFQHPNYYTFPFYENMAGLLQRADLAISRAGAGTLTELAITHTPAILIPYPYAAEDHQAYNAQTFVDAGAAVSYRQQDLTPDILKQTVLQWLNAPETLETMGEKAGTLAVKDSAVQIANMVRQAAT
ncbi:MAG: undecaprenyldiphospho-muramoylpentapeptide beta-N-acetylglucosaminyltransferase [Cyanobacteria bacterium SW_9_44_58]|nr:MAG: undecaprenyldiphospho-muramoylpentapeptide beta-N-acetylglucosaminyltransferase [Cyanobacteria bacterium SW_9_44_58]